jgi:ATP-dependent RNA helicase SUPV3L1/SUV3
MDLFPAASLVRDMQTELDSMIQQGVFQLTRLLKNSETGVSSGTSAAIDEDDFAINRQKQSYLRGIVSYFRITYCLLLFRTCICVVTMTLLKLCMLVNIFIK